MVLLGRVIGVLDSDTKPDWPPDPEGNLVYAIEYKEDLNVEIGMVYAEGKFSPYAIPFIQPPQEEIIQAEILLNQVTILENQRAQDAVMAEILLGQLGV